MYYPWYASVFPVELNLYAPWSSLNLKNFL